MVNSNNDDDDTSLYSNSYVYVKTLRKCFLRFNVTLLNKPRGIIGMGGLLRVEKGFHCFFTKT